MTIYDRIKARRIELGMTQDELAHILGYEGKSTISKVENGERDLRESTVIRYAKALGVTPAYLYFGETQANKWQTAFCERLLQKLRIMDPTDSKDASLDQARLDSIANGEISPTFSEACDIAEEFRISLDEMVGMKTEDAITKQGLLTIPDNELEAELDEADQELIDTVHNICGMSYRDISDRIDDGTLKTVYNPKKIKVVQDFITDNEKTLKIMIDNIDRQA